MNELLTTMRRLRGPDGCPWDQKQTHESLRPYLLEEACETMDAISEGDTEAIVEELGDVLLQIAFHTVIAEDTVSFTYQDIEKSIIDKLIRRHPHVFSDTEVSGADEVVTNWNEIKRTEKDGKPVSPTDSVPKSLPALMRGYELGKKLRWSQGSKESIQSALEQDGEQEIIGNVLLEVINYARSLGINPELALRDALNTKLATP